MSAESGFSLIELLLATLVMITVTGAVLGLLNPATGAFSTQPEIADLQQRVRVAASSLERDLAMAGGGEFPGLSAGPLDRYVAPVLPYRVGMTGADTPGTFRSSVITVAFVPPSPAFTRVVRVRAGAGADKIVDMQPACGGLRVDARCGFEDGMRLLVYEPEGRWDTAVLTSAEDAALHMDHPSSLAGAYDAGGAVASELRLKTYYLATDRATGTPQLMQYDGSLTDMPVVDNVVKLELQYWGTAFPPQLMPPLPPAGERPRTTYGPVPPPIGRASATTWPDGENCVFAVADGEHVPRLAALSGGPLVELTSAMLADGPWCPDETHAMRYDADLLRIRRIGVTLRVQVAAAWLRGPSSSLFMYPGTARTPRYVPDHEVRFDVAPRNVNLRR